jgi:peroxiredoxin
MRINTLRHVLSLAGLIIAATWAGLCSAPAADAPPVAQSSALSPVLQAKDAAAAWTELGEAGTPPPNPAKWRDTPPTPKEKETFYLPYVRALAAKSKDFYTKFPKDGNAGKAKMMEFRFLFMTVLWGDTSQQAQLETVEKSLVGDPALSDDERVGIVQAVAQNSAPEKARPLLQAFANGAVSAKVKAAAEEQLTRLKAIGQPVDLQYTAVDGRSVDLAKLKGKVVLIDFWATWCGPCVGEVPNVKKTYDQFHSKGFEIVGISLDKDKDKLTQFTADHKMEWPQFFDGLYWQNKYARQFGIESIPTMWLIDKKGNLRDMNAREDLSGGVEKLLAE